MRISLKKFCTEPYKTIQKAPIIIEMGGKPRYAIIPYVVYKTNYAQFNEPIAPVAFKPSKIKAFIKRLLFT